MLESYAIGLVLIVVMAVAWAGVQSAWRRTFRGAAADPDALAGRMGCHGCHCTDECEREVDPTEEDVR